MRILCFYHTPHSIDLSYSVHCPHDLAVCVYVYFCVVLYTFIVPLSWLGMCLCNAPFAPWLVSLKKKNPQISFLMSHLFISISEECLILHFLWRVCVWERLNQNFFSPWLHVYLLSSSISSVIPFDFLCVFLSYKHTCSQGDWVWYKHVHMQSRSVAQTHASSQGDWVWRKHVRMQSRGQNCWWDVTKTHTSSLGGKTTGGVYVILQTVHKISPWLHSCLCHTHSVTSSSVYLMACMCHTVALPPCLCIVVILCTVICHL